MTTAPTTARRALVGPAAAFTAVASATAYVGVVDPNHPGHYPVCPFLRLTGWWCPGCGGLRCVHALTRGDLPTALHDNALVVVGCTAAVLYWARWAHRSARGLRTVPRSPGPTAVAALIIAVLAFSVLRNLPFGAFLAP
ncbi:DUF2752 domain-containing protein [Streptacidiphilus albus]|uniref:DUF2752 domain-containing protein n=1 Tax=Streptacidiphilus albus TaxID=105425 RepID=UPI00054C5CB2|nr:DUF2752 domain-containing protein [Streptacidiphilus albus]